MNQVLEPLLGPSEHSLVNQFLHRAIEPLVRPFSMCELSMLDLHFQRYLAAG